METNIKTTVSPSRIMQIGMGFFASKILLTAVNIGLFTKLAINQLSAEDIKKEFDFHERGLYDFLDALVALGFLKRSGIQSTAIYSNSEESDLFLDKRKPTYIGGILEMSNNRLYGFWNDLEEGLKTGLPQNESKTGSKPIFEALYSDHDRLREFLRAMSSVQMGNFITFAEKFDFTSYETLCDIGGADGTLSAQVARKNSHMTCISFDLPPVAPVAKAKIATLGLSNRIKVQSGDFFKDDFPYADIITMGNILHDWGLHDKKLLIKKAWDALPEGGAYVVIENIIDNNRCENAFGLMMSLNMLIETEGGFDFSFEDFDGWAKEAGFRETFSMPLTGPSSAVIAIK